jgi:lambda repressor-like predicted transcriptional regulator
MEEKHKKNRKRWEYNKILGRLIENNSGMTQLSKDCNCSRMQVINICKGRPARYTRIRYRVQRKIAEIIKVPFHEIWGDKDGIWYGKFI